MKHGDPSYVPPEFLKEVQATFQPVKQRSYQLMGLQAGDAALDVGCGPASDTLALASLVGPAGRVVGIDRDVGMIGAANDRAASAGVANVEHIHVDAVQLPFPSDGFAACRSERVFQHLTDASRVLAEIGRVVRPAGRVVLADPDFASMSTAARDSDLLWRLKATMSDFLPNGYAATGNYELLKRAGFTEVTAEVVPVTFFKYEPFGFLLRARLGDILAAADVSAERFSEFETDARQRSAQGCFFGCINMILASGRKPASSAH